MGQKRNDINLRRPSSSWYPEGVGGAQVELLPDFLRRSGTQTVEDVVVPLLWTLPADPRLLQQVMRHEAAHNGVLPGDGKLGYTPKISDPADVDSHETIIINTFSLKWISTNFPKRLLLLFRTVFAFPNASSKGLAAGSVKTKSASRTFTSLITGSKHPKCDRTSENV